MMSDPLFKVGDLVVKKRNKRKRIYEIRYVYQTYGGGYRYGLLGTWCHVYEDELELPSMKKFIKKIS